MPPRGPGGGPAEKQDFETLRTFLARVWRLLASHRSAMWGFIVIVAATSVLRSLPPLAFKRVIDSAIPAGDRAAVVGYSALGFAAAASGAGLGVLGRWIGVRVGSSVAATLRQSMFESMLRRSLTEFSLLRPGAATQRFTSDVVAVQSGVSTTLGQGLGAVFNLAASVVAIGVLSPPMALAVIVLLPLYGLAARRAGRAIRGAVADLLTVNERFAGWLTERLSFGAMTTIKTFGSEAVLRTEMSESAKQMRSASVRRSMAGRMTFALLSVLGAMGAAIAYGVGGQFAIGGSLTVGAVVALAVYLQRLLDPLSELSGFRGDLEGAAVALQRSVEFAGDEILRSVSREAPAGFANHERRFTGLHVSGLTYQYPDRSTGSEPTPPAISDVSFDSPRNFRLGIAGPSGSGKTTLGLVLAGLLDPSSGMANYMHSDGSRASSRCSRQRAVYVAQDPFIFNTTVEENLTLGRKHIAPELEKACRLAGIWPTVAALPDRLQTVLGDRGVALSGGERQRLALARAVLNDPDVLILDEPSAHLDAETEREIHDRIAESRLSKLTVIIAHRLSTLRSCDLILVLQNGHLVERGTHDELIDMRGLYSDLWTEITR